MGSQPKLSAPPTGREQPIPTGSLALDQKLGGGWPRGRIVEIVGPEGCGKTTLLLEAVAWAQRHDRLAAFIDADHGTDQASADRLGVNLEAMPFHRTNVLEEAFETIGELAREGVVEVIALDSVAALVPEQHHACSRDGLPGHRKDENHQHRFEHFLKTLLSPLSRSRAVLLVSNHLREKVGVMFGNPETTPYETAPLRDYASQRVELRRTGVVKEREEAIGISVRAKITKNRAAPPFAQAEFDVIFATGIDRETDLVRMGLETGVLTRRGGRLLFGDVLLGTDGPAHAPLRLRRDADLAARLREAVGERLRAEPADEKETP